MSTPNRPELRFYVKIKQVEPDYEVEAPQPYLFPANTPRCPPMNKAAVKVIECFEWFEWRPGGLRSLSNDRQSAIMTFKTTSMFFNHYLAGYLHVPFDCKEISVADRVHREPLDRWKETMFHCDHEKGMTFVGHSNDGPHVGATVPRAWRGQLMPERYQCPRNHDGTEATEYSTPCRLAGDLSLLVALAAFSAPVTSFYTVMSESFRAGSNGSDWRIPSGSHGRSHEKGLIVSIGYDDQIVFRETLKKWEDGDYGAIIT